MKILTFLGIFLLPIIATTAPDVGIKPSQLKVSIYYETLCPYTIRFMKKQLFPVYAQMPEYLNLNFVPYGNTKTKTRNGTVEYRCPHGDWECRGNKVHGCAISLLERQVSNKFIKCSMSKHWPPSAGPQCARKLNISYTRIRRCSESNSGTLLVKQNGFRTKSLEPPLTGVPWVTFNDVWNKSDDAQIDYHFIRVVCKHLRNVPIACSNHTN